MTPVFAREDLPRVWSEMQPLLERHWEEIAHFKDIPLDPDRQFYAVAEATEVLRIFTVRPRFEGPLLGYAAFLIRRNPHYRSLREAYQDVLFVAPEARGCGGKFIAWCDEQLRADGVQLVLHHVKFAHDFGPLLERLGYVATDKLYARRLDK